MPRIYVTQLQFYHYLIIGGAIIAVLALLIYFVPWSRVKLPAIVIGIIASLAAGFGGGVITMAALGSREFFSASAKELGEGPPAFITNPSPAEMERMKKQMMPPSETSGQEPSPKLRLASLIDKLDLLTRKTLVLELNAEQKKKVLAQLRGLDGKDALTDSEAKAHLDTLLDLLKNDKDVLEGVDYPWSAVRKDGPQSSAIPPNPFKQGKHQKHLKTLQERLSQGEKGTGN